MKEAQNVQNALKLIKNTKLQFGATELILHTCNGYFEVIDLDTPESMMGTAPTAIKNKNIPAVQAALR